ncbi:MAG: lamin tail domain-containing protein [Candidatus Paceibacterota bacterium]
MFRKYIILTKLRWILMGLALLLSFNSAYANVIINEVQVSPSGEKFLELYNTGDSSVDLTNWQIKKKTESGTESTLVSKVRLKDKSISAGGYFLIANETSYTGQGVLDASWPPSNTTGLASNNTVLLYQDEELIDGFGWGQASDCQNPCPSNPTSGQSLQLVSGSWITATPTPGQINQSSSSSSSSNDDTGSSNTTTPENSTTTVEAKPKTITNPTMKAKIVASNLVFVGQPFAMKADISGFSNENVLLGRVYWNFGDGVSLEQVNNFEKFYHIYHYPGDYVVLVEYYRNNFSETPDATAKMIIKVIPTTVTISKVGDVNDFFIELSNNASSDIDVSSWVISANGKTFKLPKNSVIISKKQMTISGKVTGFIYGDQFNLKLFSSIGEIVFDYAPAIIPPSSIKTAPRQLAPVSATIQFPEELEEDEGVGDIEGENIFENLSASASLSDVVQENADNSYIPIVASFIFIGASAGAVYFIRQRRSPVKVGDDFELLDE